VEADHIKTNTIHHMKKLLTLLAIVFGAVTLHAGEYPDISITELKTAIAEKKVTLIDANGSDSFGAGHIPGAIDFQAQKTALADKLPSDKGALVVAYCGGPTCGAYAAAAKAAQALGYTNVKHLSAGISGWKDAGAPLEK
jgi:rhodanese-related sulfurtransferase